MNKKHFNIPIFIPELACPFQCIYCDQRKISGVNRLPDDGEIIALIEKYLLTIPTGSEIQLAFFGGNFTGIPADQQEHYLRLAEPFISSGKIGSIRISTRPDYIRDDLLHLLKQHGVQSIELGAQSLDDEVLKLSKRGHTARDTEMASKKIRDFGFSLGLQMMIGLPGDTLEKSVSTARRIVELGAADTRIYPTLVIKDTVLERMFWEKSYTPLRLEEAVMWCTAILPVFEKAGVNVLKMGLHPSEGLLTGANLVGGPFHPSFRELVESAIWNEILKPLTDQKAKTIEILVPPDQINYATGYHGSNKKMLENYYSKVKFRSSDQLTGRSIKVHFMD
jgi:histone acetyltransferase (RNA polymerase elongator complex component)